MTALKFTAKIREALIKKMKKEQHTINNFSNEIAILSKRLNNEPLHAVTTGNNQNRTGS